MRPKQAARIPPPTMGIVISQGADLAYKVTGATVTAATVTATAQTRRCVLTLPFLQICN
jgi:hypothetical protein